MPLLLTTTTVLYFNIVIINRGIMIDLSLTMALIGLPFGSKLCWELLGFGSNHDGGFFSSRPVSRGPLIKSLSDGLCATQSVVARRI